MSYTRKMMKKGFICLLAFLFVMASLTPATLPSTPAAANESDYYEYVNNEDGTATITGYNGPEGVDIAIPSVLGGLEVTAIADGAGLLTGVFSHKDVTAVDIPDSITSIGDNAFNDNQLTEVMIPDSVTRIGTAAFRNNGLEAVIIPDSVTNMGAGVFSGNQHISSDFTIYGFTNSEAETYANDSNHTFKPLDTPPSVHIRYAGETVADEMQVDLQSSGILEAVYRHDTEVVEIDHILWEVDGEEAGTEDTLPLDSYTDTTGERTVTLTVETNYGISATEEITLDVILPVPDQPELLVGSRTDTSIALTWGSVAHANEYILLRDEEEVYRGTSTSYEDTGLKPDTAYDYFLEAENASGTSEVSTLTVTTDFPPSEFEYTANGDRTATIDGWNDDVGDVPSDLVIPAEIDGLTVTRISDGSIFDGAFRDLSIETLHLPDTLKYIGSYAFAENHLESVTIPDDVTEIGARAFEENRLTSLDIPDGVEEIRGSAFFNNSLESVEIPDSVTTIRASVFQANELESVTLPDSVTEIEGNAFLGNNLKSVTIYNNEVNIASSSFNINNDSLTLYGWEGSTTENYAKNEGYTFIALDSKPNVNILYAGEEVGSEFSLDYEETGQLESDYSHDFADIVEVTWLVDGIEISTNETLDVSDFTSTPQTLDVTLRVETEYGAVGTADITITVVPPVPAQPSLSVDSSEETEIHLSWSPVQYADEYILVRDDEEEVYRGSATSYGDTGLKPDTAYAYSLVAVNDSGTSDASTVTAATELPVPATPSLTVAETTTRSISLSWEAVQYATEYILKRIEGEEEEELYKGSGASVSFEYEDDGLNPNTSYTYTLVAINTSGASAADEITVSTERRPPSTPPEPDPPVEPREINVQPVPVDDGGFTIDDDVFTQLAEQDTLVVDLGEAELDTYMSLRLTESQIAQLVALKVDIRISSDLLALTVPAVNLDSEETTISWERLEPDEGLAVPNTMHRFGIDQGAQPVRSFNEPVTLAFPVNDGSAYEPELLHVFHWNNEDGEWQRQESTYEKSIVRALVDHFSIFAVYEADTDVLHEPLPPDVLPAVERIGGDDRYVTNLMLSQRVADHSLDTVILATGNNFPDALAGSTLMHALNGQVLLVDTRRETVPKAQLAEIERVLSPDGTILILGGTTAIPESIELHLNEAFADTFAIERLYGENRNATAAAIAAIANNSPERLILVRDDDFADAMTILPYASRENIPLLLQRSDVLPDDIVRQYIQQHNIQQVTIVGGTTAISEQVEAALKDMNIQTERIAGENRYRTALEIKRRFFAEARHIILATGLEFADSLGAGRLAYETGAPILLTRADTQDKQVEQYLNEAIVNKYYTLGGAAAIRETIVQRLIERP